MVDANKANHTDAGLEKILESMGLTEEQKAQLRKAKASESRSRRSDEKDILAKRPHAIPGSLGFDTTANKQFMVINCQVEGCKETRRVFTSDLHQVKTCVTHKDEQRKAAKLSRKELIERFAKAEAAEKAKAAAPDAPEVDAPEVAEPQEA